MAATPPRQVRFDVPLWAVYPRDASPDIPQGALSGMRFAQRVLCCWAFASFLGLTVAAQSPPATLSLQAPVYKSNKKGTNFTPFSSEKAFSLTVRLYSGSSGEPLLDDLGQPWQETFTVTAKS